MTDEDEMIPVKRDDLIALHNIHYSLEALIGLMFEAGLNKYSCIGHILNPIEQRMAEVIKDFPEM